MSVARVFTIREHRLEAKLSPKLLLLIPVILLAVWLLRPQHIDLPNPIPTSAKLAPALAPPHLTRAEALALARVHLSPELRSELSDHDHRLDFGAYPFHSTQPRDVWRLWVNTRFNGVISCAQEGCDRVPYAIIAIWIDDRTGAFLGKTSYLD